MSFAINPPGVPFVYPDNGRLTPEGYRFLAQVHRIIGEDAVASLLAAPFLTFGPDATLTADKVLTAGTGMSFSSGASTFTIAIGTNAVSNALFRQSAALSVVGRSADSAGNVADIAAASDHQILRRSGTAIGFGAVDLTQSAAVTGALAAANGGTGLASYTVGDILYASGATAISALADVATGNALISGGVGVAPSWGKIGMTTHVSGTLPIANGGTNATTASAARTSLGVAIGSDVQAYSANLDEYAAVNPTAAGLALLDDADAEAQRTTLGLASGTYTPTLTNVANLDASTAYQCQYMRVGSVVTVSGKVDIDPTAAGVSTELGISLPIASNLGAREDCAGTAFSNTIAGQGAAIRADFTNDRAELMYLAGDTTNVGMFLQFTYEII